MALSRRTGFTLSGLYLAMGVVDAMTGLLLVLMFVLDHLPCGAATAVQIATESMGQKAGGIPLGLRELLHWAALGMERQTLQILKPNWGNHHVVDAGT